MTLAEITYPLIDPVVVRIAGLPIRWYGVSYVVAFVLAFLVLRGLARKGRWPVEPDRVADVLFWGILGVFVGGRIGWILFYALEMGEFSWGRVYRVWEGGMSFHGGLLGVIVAYWIYLHRTRKPIGEFFGGLAVAAPLGILCVRLANFVNAELYGRVWDGAWAMRFPRYQAEGIGTPEKWYELHEQGQVQGMWTELRHPSQLYEGLGEGLLLFFFLRWLLLKRGVGGGFVAATFLMCYGTFRFLIEFVREPDVQLGTPFLGILTKGQQLCVGMVIAGAVVFWLSARAARRRRAARGEPA